MHKEVAYFRSDGGTGARGTASACKKTWWWACWAPLAGDGTAGISFNRRLRYSEEGPLPCIIDIASGKQGSDVKGENGFTRTQKCTNDCAGPTCTGADIHARIQANKLVWRFLSAPL